MKQRLLIGIVSVSTLTVFSTGLTFADTDLKAKVRIWADQQAGSALSVLKQSISSETEVQKARLQEELRLGLQLQAEEMNKFTEQQRSKYSDELRAHADSLIAGLEFESEEDKAEMLRKLEAIAASAEQAMNHLEDSYTPPAPVMENREQAVTAPESQTISGEETPSSVTDDVYSE
ncbi:hypothetical protein [Paenibacillus sp. PK3_47]|uniref:hypothetical protein n=1 Tax=Paenibacillus sp. PK3_47 TaxID=2072642 RepID=UPI00201E05FA|nr:hypothetical protein [Paenibacillus sp. PK3_47]